MARLALIAVASVTLAACAGGYGGGARKATMSPVASGTAAESVAAYAPDADDGGGGGSTAVTAASIATTPARAAGGEVIPEQLVIEGFVRAEVDDVRAAAAGLRAAVEAAGGRVINEDVAGAAESWRASLRLRLPPGAVDGVLAFLAGHGDVTEKRITATDVSRTLFEQALELGNKRAALDRLRQLYDQGGLVMADILAIEKELTRLRGEIEQLEGSQRFLQDRVALATLDVALDRRDGAVLSPESKFYPGARVAVMTLFDAGGRARTRLGGGLVIHAPVPRVSWELDVFEEEASPDGARHRAVLATFGGAAYSDFLGRGKRSFLNPYLGARLGYGYLDGSSFVAQAEAGVELFKNRHVLVDLGARLTGFLANDRVDTALVSGGSVVLAF